VSKAAKRERQRQNRDLARARETALAKRRQRTKAARNAIIAAVLVFGVVLLINTFTGSKSKKKATTATTSAVQRTFSAPPATTIDPAKTYTATMATSEGTITLALDAKNAPVATNNFVFLSNKHFYDGLTFHRVVKDFVIQGGDPKGDGSGGPGYTVKGEPPTDHYPVGALAAAKTGSDPAGTFGSQFFIVTGSQGATLPNDYARFGKVTGGLDVAKKIESFATSDPQGKPSKTVKITSVTIAVS
jgi:cyclophilin family peptidyl-prolyl cis-trans isomerase